MARILAHAHSDWSHDGTFTLEEWVRHARERRIDAVLLSEHEETGWTPGKYADYAAACRAASTNEVSLVPGIEFSQDGFHVLCYGLEHFPPRPSTAAELAGAVREQGCWLCLAHPGKYGWHHPAPLVEAADAVEVWNSKWIYDGNLGPHPASLKLAAGKRLFAGQDVHKVKHFSPLFIETDGREGLADIAAGRYRIVHGEKRFTAEQLKSGALRQAAQLGRTRAMKAALVMYRLARGKHPFPHRRAARVAEM
jgi:hypothetical protein